MTIWAAIMLVLLIAALAVSWMHVVVFVPERVENLFTASVMLYAMGVGLSVLRMIADVQDDMFTPASRPGEYGDYGSIGVYQQAPAATNWWNGHDAIFNTPYYLSAALFGAMLIVCARWWMKRKEPMKVSRKRARSLSRW